MPQCRPSLYPLVPVSISRSREQMREHRAGGGSSHRDDGQAMFLTLLLRSATTSL
jgi:hypothetical protein